jgi:hypothetical protein
MDGTAAAPKPDAEADQASRDALLSDVALPPLPPLTVARPEDASAAADPELGADDSSRDALLDDVALPPPAFVALPPSSLPLAQGPPADLQPPLLGGAEAPAELPPPLLESEKVEAAAPSGFQAIEASMPQPVAIAPAGVGTLAVTAEAVPHWPVAVATAAEANTSEIVGVPQPLLRGPALAPPEVGPAMSVGAPPIPEDWLKEAEPEDQALALDNKGSALENVLSRLPKMPQVGPIVPEELKELDIKAKRLLQSLPRIYCETMARYPWAFLIVWTVIMAAVISAAWRPVTVNTDIEEFRRVDGQAAHGYSTFLEAARHQKSVKNISSIADRTTHQVELYYEAKGGSVFTEAALRDIRVFETQLRGLGGWIRMCAMSDSLSRFRCEPGESLSNYVWPTRIGDLTPFNVTFNGMSNERLPVQAVLTYLNDGTAAPHDLKKFLPSFFSGPKANSVTLRSTFSFTAPVAGHAEEFTKEYKQFVAEELFPFLKKATERAEEEPDDPWTDPWAVRLYFRGREIEAHEVRYYLAHDLKLLIGMVVFQFIFLWLQLRSLFLAVIGLMLITMVPLLTYVTVPIDELSLASFVCLFIVVAFACNDLPATAEYWRRLGKDLIHKYPVRSDRLGYRDELLVYYSYRLHRLFPALFFRFLPQLLTMISFLAFLGSGIRPIREFGLFMFTGTSLACLVCVAVFPPVLILHELYVCPKVHRAMPAALATILEPKKLRFPWRPLVRVLLRICKPQIGKFIWLGVGSVTLIIFVITVIVAAHSDGPGLPEVYSPVHHGNAGRPVVGAFSPSAPALQPSPASTNMCSMIASLTGSEDCGLHWCEAPLAPETPGPATECSCQVPVAKVGCQYLKLNASIAGSSFVGAGDDDRKASLQKFIQIVNGIPADKIAWKGSKGSLSPSLVLEHWDSGKTDIEPVVQMPEAVITLNSTAGNKSCPWHINCYCGQRLCNTKSIPGHDMIYQPNKMFVTTATNRLLSSTGASGTSRDIIIVFGITLPKDTDFIDLKPEWKLDSSFQPTSPWAQRAMLKMCDNVPPHLGVVQSECWIQDFKKWMTAKGKKFPTQRFGDFQGELRDFKREQTHVRITAMWTDSQNNMVATAFTFKVPARSNAKAKEILDEKVTWDAYVSGENEASSTSGSNAWATALSWAEAEAEDHAMSNAWLLLLLTLGIVIVSGLLYTWDFAFTGISVGVAIVAMLWLGFFMFCIFVWAIGPWEVILWVVFLMYSVEPAFRVGRGAVWGGILAKEMTLSGNNVTPLPAKSAPSGDSSPAQLQLPPAPAPDAPAAMSMAALMDTQAVEHVPSGALDTTSEVSATDSFQAEAAARSEFEGRLHQFIQNNANSCIPGALKLFIGGFFLLCCDFRLFTRLGAVTMVIEIVKLPCLFILLPSAILLCPTRERPDILVLISWLQEKWNARDAS